VAEWLKVLIGALAGLIVGLVSDPLKTWINGKLKEREIRRALYRSMADLYGFYSSKYEAGLRERYPMAFENSNLDIFDHYFTTEKAAFFRLPEAPFVRTFFTLVRDSFDQRGTHVGRQEDIDAIKFCMQSGLRSGSIDAKRLNRLISKGPSWRAKLQVHGGK
jgi:hypothetical protein